MAIPYLTLADPRAAIALYEKALGAKVTMNMDGPDGSVMHAELDIGGDRLMLSGVWPGMTTAPEGRSPVNFMLYVDNADTTYKHAIEEGMTSVSEPEDMFWGDRVAKVNDGHGYEWTFAHQIEDVSPEEVQKRAAEFMASMGE
ncbi:MAG: VOC family protein [Gammaproteobacteria bacterium]|nr:VOC family protein [Gammaproteobacteria bacterium]